MNQKFKLHLKCKKKSGGGGWSGPEEGGGGRRGGVCYENAKKGWGKGGGLVGGG